MGVHASAGAVKTTGDGVAGEFFQSGPDCFEDQFQARQLTGRRQDVGGVGALPTSLLDQSGGRKPSQGKV
jgi:hypothetical protein